jgi:hypothetical protein
MKKYTTIKITKDFKKRLEKNMVKGSFEYNLRLWLNKIEKESKKK